MLTKFDLIINLKTTKALGLDVPWFLQQRAAKVNRLQFAALHMSASDVVDGARSRRRIAVG